VVVLDEPTSGLDPLSRAAVWDLVRELVADGATLLLTTQYLEEADRLADRIAVVDAGRVVAEGTPGELKALVGGKRLEITLLSAGDAAAAVRAVGDLADGEATHIGDRVQVPLREGYRSLVDVVRRLDAAGVEVGDVSVSEPSLDDVFLRLTGHRTSPAEGEAA
jgi:ABC-2 type transport system ATP-binding protein